MPQLLRSYDLRKDKNNTRDEGSWGQASIPSHLNCRCDIVWHPVPKEKPPPADDDPEVYDLNLKLDW
jgi:hypothetical protein